MEALRQRGVEVRKSWWLDASWECSEVVGARREHPGPGVTGDSIVEGSLHTTDIAGHRHCQVGLLLSSRCRRNRGKVYRA